MDPTLAEPFVQTTPAAQDLIFAALRMPGVETAAKRVSETAKYVY